MSELFERARIAQRIADEHAVEASEIEHRRVAGAPSWTLRCRCGDWLDPWDYAEHVALQAIDAARELHAAVAS